MVFVACSGFPVPVSRYWRDFEAVELADTELGLPGSGTIGRWKRESPDGFGFSIIAPKSISDEEFKQTENTQETLQGLGRLVETLDARAAVFIGSTDFKSTKANKARLKSFLATVPDSVPYVVFDLPSWDPSQVASIAKSRLVAAYDPLQDTPPPAKGLAYIRLPGPAGKRSRYDDESLERIADHVREIQDSCEEIFIAFRNIDMHTNATALRKRLKI